MTSRPRPRGAQHIGVITQDSYSFWPAVNCTTVYKERVAVSCDPPASYSSKSLRFKSSSVRSPRSDRGTRSCAFATAAKVPAGAPSSSYELMHEADFPVLRIGNRLVVPKEKFIQQVEQHTQRGSDQ